MILLSGEIDIRVRGLGKKYSIGGSQEEYLTLRDALVNVFKIPFRRLTQKDVDQSTNEFWALRNVSFDVHKGEIIGIIGRNGAGKSTLLKILSRITTPTEGEADIFGRVGSLLEVGTGFHPELTGRENIFLSGSILGMRKSEIEERFDEIVKFSEIEKFLDTPVKRYSSGMYVRLAFAVAAHMDTEILIVDEVLAVGDAQFQKKCMGKMEDVARVGRTVLFVSHNMAAIQKLCSRCLLLVSGEVYKDGPVSDVITTYLNMSASVGGVSLAKRVDRKGNGDGRLTALFINDSPDDQIASVCSGDTVRFHITFKIQKPISSPIFYLAIYNNMGTQIIHCNTELQGFEPGPLHGEGEIVCEIPRLPLPPGLYKINIAIGHGGGGEIVDHVESAALMDVLAGDFYGTGHYRFLNRGICLADHRWRFIDS